MDQDVIAKELKLVFTDPIARSVEILYHRQIYQFEDTCIGSINNNQAQRSIVQIYGMEDVSYSSKIFPRSQIHVIRSISIMHLCESNSIATQTSQFVGIH